MSFSRSSSVGTDPLQPLLPNTNIEWVSLNHKQRYKTAHPPFLNCVLYKKSTAVAGREADTCVNYHKQGLVLLVGQHDATYYTTQVKSTTTSHTPSGKDMNCFLIRLPLEQPNTHSLCMFTKEIQLKIYAKSPLLHKFTVHSCTTLTHHRLQVPSSWL